MAHLQYLPGDPRLVDQLVYELKSKGIFDQFRKECIADVDTRPAYQNLRQRVENSVSTFLSRQCWKPDLNKNQLREKLRKHILDGNYLEQGVDRIVDQVVNPKVASVFIPQVEDLVYNYLGITRKKSSSAAETSNGKPDDLLPTDLEAVSPGSVKSNDDKNEAFDVEMAEDTKDIKMDIDETNGDVKDESSMALDVIDKEKTEQDTQLSGISELTINDSDASIDKSTIPLPSQDIILDNIPAPDNSPPKQPIDLERIQLPEEPNLSTDIPLPDEVLKAEKEHFFKPVNSDDDDSSSDSSLRRNMSPLTPIRNFNNENSCDAQQAFENDSDGKADEKKEPSSFRFTIENKSDNSTDGAKAEKKDSEPTDATYQFNNQVNVNSFNTPLYEDSSSSNNLQIDYESDVNSKINTETKLPEGENSEDVKKDKKIQDDKSRQKHSHKSRDSSRQTTSKDKRTDSKHSSRDSSRHARKSSKDDSKSKSSNKERDRSKDRSEKKDSRDSSKHRSSHKSSSNRDSKSSSHKRSRSSQKHSSKHSDDKKSSKDRTPESSISKDKSRDIKNSHRSEKDQKDRKSKKDDKDKNKDDKDKKKDKKDTDDHYSLSGRGSHTRRSTDRDSNDGSSSSKGSSNPSNTKTTECKKESKETSKSDNTPTCGESTSPSDREHVVDTGNQEVSQARPIVRVETHLEVPIAAPPRLPFVPDVTLKKPKFAANFKEAKRLMKMRKFLDEEQKRMNQEAVLLLEFQANVRPSLSQVYSSIPGPELEFACGTNPLETARESRRSCEIALEPANIGTRKMTVQEIENIIGVNVTGRISDSVYEQDSVENGVDRSENETCDNEANDETGLIEQNREERVKIKHSYEDNDNKPFSDIIDEITKYKNASDSKMHLDRDDPNMEKLHDDENKKRTEFFEITIITEELSETEDPDNNAKRGVTNAGKTDAVTISKSDKKSTPSSPGNEISDTELPKRPLKKSQTVYRETELAYFGETEKYNAELERDQFGTFLKRFIENTATTKLHLINCDTYRENILKEVSGRLGRYKTVNYCKNGHLNLARNVVKNVSLAEEISLPLENIDSRDSPVNSMIFSPVKSDCSFELSSEYDAKLEEMVNKTSRQEVMEIILGGVIDESPSEMPKIDYCSESSIEGGELKRKCEVDTNMNNNTQVLGPNKIRKLSASDQISSTTEETEEEVSNNNRMQNNTRSKYLGRARRVGLPRPKKSVRPNSPLSEKSVENYEENAPSAHAQPPNGKLKSAPRIKIQRYDTSDLYKPKLHYLSRRNNIT